MWFAHTAPGSALYPTIGSSRLLPVQPTCFGTQWGHFGIGHWPFCVRAIGSSLSSPLPELSSKPDLSQVYRSDGPTDFQDLWVYRPWFGLGQLTLPERAVYRAPSLDKTQYDLTTYWGRVRIFAAVTSAWNLLAPFSYASSCRELVRAYDRKEWVYTSQEELWHARQVASSVYHPDTGEPVFLPFRLSAFVPTNLAICVGLTQPRASLRTALLWQWINQSYNVMLNHHNRNASVPFDGTAVARSYVGAVSVSMGLAWGLRAGVERLTRIPPMARDILGRLVPWVSVASAGFANVLLIRFHEISEGISVYSQPLPGADLLPCDADERYGTEGRPPAECLGLSRRAAVEAVGRTAVSRVVLSTPILTIPALAIWAFERLKVFERWPRSQIPLSLFAALVALQVALPVATGVFPQTASLPVSVLEPEFQNLTDPSGREITHVYFNRGL